jgi:hypothetical protein
MSGSTFTWRNSANDIRSILNHLFSMKCTLFAGESLHHQPGRLINQNAQCTAPIIELKK